MVLILFSYTMDSKCPYFCWLSFLFFISQLLMVFRLIKMFPSKESVRCFYCEWASEKDKLVSHSNVHYLSSKVQVKIASIALSTFYLLQPRQKGQRMSTTIHLYTIYQQQLPTTSPVTTPATTSIMSSAFSPSNEYQLQQQLSYRNRQLLNLNTKFDSLLVTKSSIPTTKEANEEEDKNVQIF